MADPNDPATAAARLEAALERIAVMVDEVAAGPAPDPAAEDAPDVSEVAARLDALIAKLRTALSGRPA